MRTNFIAVAGWLLPSARAWEAARILCPGKVSCGIPGDKPLGPGQNLGCLCAAQRDSALASEGKPLTGVLALYECVLLLHMGTHITQLGLGRRACKYIDLQEHSRQPS